MEYNKNTEMYLYYNGTWFYISTIGEAPTVGELTYAPTRIELLREDRYMALILWDNQNATGCLVGDAMTTRLVEALLPVLVKDQSTINSLRRLLIDREAGQAAAEGETSRIKAALQSKEAEAIRERIRAEKAEAALKKAQDEASDNFVAAFAIGAAVAGVVGLIIGAIIGASSSEDEVAEDAPARVIFFVMDQAAPSVVG